MRGRSFLLCACALFCAVAAERDLKVLQADTKAVFYVGIAAPATAVDVVRAFNKSLAEVSATYLAGDYPPHLRNITLQPLYIELPEDGRFSARVLESACAALQGKRVAALLVCGAGAAASAVVSTATRAGVPVLRTSPTHPPLFYTIANELLPLEIRLEITARETLYALRATLLHTHWHTFTLLAEEDIYSALSLRKDLFSILTAQPLNPKWLSLPARYSRRALFRRLAEISRLTRGVVVLVCDLNYAKRVIDEAKRLNMLDGHFFWLWIDASKDVDVFHDFADNIKFKDADSILGNTDPFLNEFVERSKRYKVDNNLQKYLEDGDIKISVNKDSKIEDSIAVQSKINSSNSLEIKNILFETHRISNNSSKYSSNIVKNEIVYKKGVETSKIEDDLLMKDSIILKNDKYRLSRSIKSENEYFNKYVNSINLDEELKDDSDLQLVREDSRSRDLNYSNFLQSDTSEFLMNPTVHASTMNNLKDKVRKRGESIHTLNADKMKEQLRDNASAIFNSLPIGLLALHPQAMNVDKIFVEAAVRLMTSALRRVLHACDAWSTQAQFFNNAKASCWEEPSDEANDFSTEFVRETRISTSAALAGGTEYPERALTASFALLNLISSSEKENKWRQVGLVQGRKVKLHTIIWPGGRLVAHGQSAGARTIFRVVTALAPPFVMEGELDEDGQCLRGLLCHRPQTSDKDNLTLAFNQLEREDQEAEDFFFPTPQPTVFSRMATHCCYGLAMDLLENIAQELEFDFHLYIVEDGLFGSRKLVRPFRRLSEYRSVANEFLLNQHTINIKEYLLKVEDEELNTAEAIEQAESDDKWDGIVGDLVSGAAHMSFSALSVSTSRAEAIDFSQPFFFSGVSTLAAPNQRPDIPLLAFLLPFSPELWIAIFTSLNVTAIAVAIYEWLSPFGLNPWGRQRSKNFSIASALWVMWGLLCGHLVAFKAPKSWPNKFLINVWGGFSVIFVASYTANIAALIAGLFFHNAVDDFQGRNNWLALRVGTAKSSVSEYYIQRNNPELAQQMRRYTLHDVEEGIEKLRNGTLDLLIADTPVLDYYRATDHACKLQRVGDHILAEDTYAIGMAKGFPLKDSISAVIAKYSSNGYMDILTEKWYGGLPCFKLSPDYGIQPKPLGVAAVAGVFILLGVGMIVGCLILVLEHLFYKYTLPILRHQPKGTIWRSRNIMFFSQKLYRFINCVELVSPHHAARELVNTIRQGHFTSLFQKSVKRKEHEQRRRRKSKAQFFEMIQEIRRVQQGRDHALNSIKENVAVETSEASEELTESKFLSPSPEVPSIRSPRSRSPRMLRSPRHRRKRCSLAGLNVRRFSTDSVLESDSTSFYERTSLNIGRRLSRDISCLTNSPPDINTRLRTPSPMARRAEGSSVRSIEEVSNRTNRHYLTIEHPNARNSVEILISHDEDTTPIPPYGRPAPTGVNSEISRVSEEELLRLWRNTEPGVRESLLNALQNNQTTLNLKQDPG